MIEMQEISAAYNGDLDGAKNFLAQGVLTCVSEFLGKKSTVEDYYMDAMALVFKGDADHPGHFLKYKKLLDYYIKKHGACSHFFKRLYTYYRHDLITYENTFLREEIHVSEQMKTYLKFLEKRHFPEREKVVSLLDDITEIAKQSPPQQRETLYKAKRAIAKWAISRQKD